MAELCLKQWGLAETEKLFQALNEPPKTALRVNTLHSSVDALRQHFPQVPEKTETCARCAAG